MIEVDGEGRGSAPRSRIARMPARGGRRPAVDPVEESRLAAAAAQTRAAESRAQRSEEQARRANATTTQAVTTLVNERVTSAERRLANATSSRTSAQQKFRAAREAGDFEAEQAAIGEMSKADYEEGEANKELRTAKAEQERLKTAPPAGTTENPTESPITQAWIDKHPLIFSDPDYRAEAAKADSLAISKGFQRGTQPYVDFCDKELEDVFGPGHGVAETHGQELTRRSLEDYSPPRGGGGGRGDYQDEHTPARRGGEGEVRTGIGTIRLRYGQGGEPIITFPNAETRADFEQGARACGMNLADYALEQVAIAQDESEGRPTGLFREEEARTYR